MDARAAGLVSAQANARALRRGLNPTVVMLHYGYTPETVEKTRINYINPFRNDHRASLNVWFDGDTKEWRIGDFAEAFQGSSIDLILRFNPDWTLSNAMELARLLYQQQLIEGAPYLMRNATVAKDFKWPNPKHDDNAAAVWHHHYSRTHPSLPPVGFLRTNFHIFVMPNEMVYAPYYDSEDQIVGYKTLSRKGKRAGVGSKQMLYGTRRALRMFRDTQLPVVVCEGESDTWVMEYLFGDEYVVVGFPGANSNIDDILGAYDESVFTGRNFTMCFDGDAAGTSGRQEVSQWIKRKGGRVCIIPMPRGRDVADLSSADVKELFQNWQMPYGEIQRIGKFGTSYRRLGTDNAPGAEVTNWSVKIHTLLIGVDIDDYALECTLEPTGRKVVLTADHFRGAQRLIDFSQANARNFFGTTQDAQKLGSYLLHEATLAPVGRITSRVGLHRGDFVWASGSIGSENWHYVPRPTGMTLRGEQTWVAQRSKAQALRTLRLLTEMHRPEVVMPMLSWMAVAPLRPLFRAFPILHLSGSSGSGKTTLTQNIMTMFSGSQITTNLTTTTPFAISAHFMASNGFPIWFDEYRPGARDDAKKSLDQLLRDTYTGQVSTKGAMNTNKAEVTEILTDTPVIVTGEDTLSEKSHVDRSIIINIPLDGKNEKALTALEFDTPLAGAYLDFLFKNNFTQAVSLPDVVFPEDCQLSNRQKANFQVLQYGYNLLQSFADYLCTSVGPDGSEHRTVDWHLPPRSWDEVLKSAAVASNENPILELIRWAYEQQTDCVIRMDEIGMYGVSTVELMRIQNSPSGPRLPVPFEKHTALGRWLEDNVHAEVREISHMGKHKRMWCFPTDQLDQQI